VPLTPAGTAAAEQPRSSPPAPPPSPAAPTQATPAKLSCPVHNPRRSRALVASRPRRVSREAASVVSSDLSRRSSPSEDGRSTLPLLLPPPFFNHCSCHDGGTPPTQRRPAQNRASHWFSGSGIFTRAREGDGVRASARTCTSINAHRPHPCFPGLSAPKRKAGTQELLAVLAGCGGSQIFTACLLSFGRESPSSGMPAGSRPCHPSADPRARPPLSPCRRIARATRRPAPNHPAPVLRARPAATPLSTPAKSACQL